MLWEAVGQELVDPLPTLLWTDCEHLWLVVLLILQPWVRRLIKDETGSSSRHAIGVLQ